MQVTTIGEKREVAFYEGEFLVKTLEGKAELTQAHRLRHRVFAETLRWVPPTEDGEEMDMYDLWGSSIGLVDRGGKLLVWRGSCLPPDHLCLRRNYVCCCHRIT